MSKKPTVPGEYQVSAGSTSGVGVAANSATRFFMPQLCAGEVTLNAMSNEKLMQDRYGRASKPSRGKVVALASTLFAIFMVWAVWVSFFSAAEPKPVVQGYEVIDENSTVVRFSVIKPAGTKAFCAVEVLSKSYAVVGYREVVIGPETSDDAVLEVTVNTTSLGVTGLVEKCSLK